MAPETGIEPACLGSDQPRHIADAMIIQRLRERAIVGTGDQVGARLRDLATTFGLDEIVVNTWTHDPAARHRSYELIAQAAPDG